jgi:acyl-coenzyme A synthetase/AMP-(fatty) acid ligase
VRYVLTSHAIGGTAINASFAGTTQELQRLVGELGATIVVMTPWQLRGLLSSAAPPARRRLELKVLYVAGAACAPQEIQAARDAITPNVGVSYGCTEVGLISFLRPTDAVGPAGSVGRLVPGLEAHAADDDYRPVPSGTVGNLGFRAPWIPDGYVGNAQATAAHFHDGWFYPGDVGAVDPERRVSLFGRSDDVINFGGVKLLPDLIEAVLGEHPDIQDVAVVGAPHPMAGQAPVALVVLRRPVAPTALMTFAKSRIQGSQVPVAFVEVPQIFRSADGKILRARLLDEYNVAAS